MSWVLQYPDGTYYRKCYRMEKGRRLIDQVLDLEEAQTFRTVGAAHGVALIYGRTATACEVTLQLTGNKAPPKKGKH